MFKNRDFVLKTSIKVKKILAGTLESSTPTALVTDFGTYLVDFEFI
jgi:hypothetical protein